MNSTFDKVIYSPDILNKTYGYWTVISPYKYRINNHYYYQTKCVCGSISYVRESSIKFNHSSSCKYCHSTKYEILTKDISIMWVFNNVEYVPVLVNTDCVEILSNYVWYFRKRTTSNLYDVMTCLNGKTILVYNIIFDFINKKYNIKYQNPEQIDHIDGNTLNNLYFPFNINLNNLRCCTSRQNMLNIKSNGYIKRSNGKYEAYINNSTNHQIHHICVSPQECITWNESQLLDIDKPFYYYSKLNPRNNPNTFSNTILNAIGYNDIDDDIFSDNDFENNT